jgi:uncharacterized protein
MPMVRRKISGAKATLAAGPAGRQPIQGVSTDVTGFVGFARRGPYAPTLVTSAAEFERMFGAPESADEGFLPYAVRGFFDNGGRKGYIARVERGSRTKVAAADFIGNMKAKTSQRRGLAALAEIAEISLLALADAHHPQFRANARPSIVEAAIAQCEERRDRIAFIDAPVGARDLGRSDPFMKSIKSSYAAVYGPWLELPAEGGSAVLLPPSGHVAGIYARNDKDRGVAKAPAGAQAEIRGIEALSLNLNQRELAALAEDGLNAIADFRTSGRGIVLWGARTRSTDPEWKYVNVQRLAIFIEASVSRGLQWVVFEPNGEVLWRMCERR